MAEDTRVVAEFTLPPHLLKFVATNLSARTSHKAPASMHVARTLTRVIRPRMELMPHVQRRGHRLVGALPLQLMVSSPPILDPMLQAALRDAAHNLLHSEVHTLQSSHRHMPPHMRVALVRTRYGITEQDLPVHTMLDQHHSWLRTRSRIPHRLPTPKPRHQARISHCSPSGAHVANLYTDPGVQLYLLRCLNPVSMHQTPYGWRLAEVLAEQLDLLLMLAEPPCNGTLRLAVAKIPGELLPLDTHKRAVLAAERIYTSEFYLTVDRMRAAGNGMRASILHARENYSISDDDVPLETSMRSYRRYLKRRGMANPRGRPPRRTGTIAPFSAVPLP